MAKSPKPDFSKILSDVAPMSKPQAEAVATEPVQINVKLDGAVKKALDRLVALRKVDESENASQREIIQEALLMLFASDTHADRLAAVLNRG